jgi:hypothetical protein
MGLEEVGCSLLKGYTHPLSEETDENQENTQKEHRSWHLCDSVQSHFCYAALSVCLLLPQNKSAWRSADRY